MQIFVGEFVCGGGLSDVELDRIPQSLRREGKAMLDALVSDLSQFSDTVIPLDPRVKVHSETTEPQSENECHQRTYLPIRRDQALWGQWVEAAKSCDAALVIAPESDGVLAQAVGMLRAAGIDVIAGSGDFLRVASDKLLTAKTLLRAGIAHPPSYCVSEGPISDELAAYTHFVVKPRDGCGTQEIRRFQSLDKAIANLEENEILQAWIPGQPISISLISSPTGSVFLPAVSQVLEKSTLEYGGGLGPLTEEAQRRATALASRAIAAMPPTARGFVGLDLLLGNSPSEDVVIEINPRLTTSYVGLRHMIRGNLAARLFDLETGPVFCETAVESVKWNPEGVVATSNDI